MIHTESFLIQIEMHLNSKYFSFLGLIPQKITAKHGLSIPEVRAVQKIAQCSITSLKFSNHTLKSGN